jgi:hypothetical protein
VAQAWTYHATPCTLSCEQGQTRHCCLQEIEERGVQPELYPYGSRGPVGAHYLAAKHGVRWGDLAADDD